MAAVVVITV
jgi:hypothetical protein